jgi:Fur family transcriptional regulator, ferric uptake regulator
MTAPTLAFTPEAILNRLRAEGLRITASRRKILEVLFQAGKPLSLQEIQDLTLVRRKGPDYATVFRMMTLLESLHLVHKVNLQRSCSYYELNDPKKHYDHIVCTRCGKVVVIDIPCPLRATEEHIARHYGFSALTHSLEFFGTCPDCGPLRPAKKRRSGGIDI